MKQRRGGKCFICQHKHDLVCFRYTVLIVFGNKNWDPSIANESVICEHIVTAYRSRALCAGRRLFAILCISWKNVAQCRCLSVQAGWCLHKMLVIGCVCLGQIIVSVGGKAGVLQTAVRFHTLTYAVCRHAACVAGRTRLCEILSVASLATSTCAQRFTSYSNDTCWNSIVCLQFSALPLKHLRSC
jgi:hypothetical protein